MRSDCDDRAGFACYYAGGPRRRLPRCARNDMSGKLPEHGRFGRISVVSGPRRPDFTAILPGRDGCLGSIAWETSVCLRSRAGNARKNRMSQKPGSGR